MNKKLIVVAVAAGLALPMTSASALEVAGKKLNVYGKLHLSIDQSDTDGLVTTDGTSVSSNSSRLGFKGELPAGALKFVYQVESEVFYDEAGGKLANRNTYAGLKGDFGKFIVGNYDTPFKTVASKWGVFGDSVGERRSVLGAGYSKGNQLNERAQNSMMYEMKTKSLKFQALYAVDPESGSDGLVDNSKKNVLSLGLIYKAGPVWIGVAQETWEGHSKIENGDALRLGAKFKVSSNVQLGLIYESIDSESVNEWKRDAYGFNAKFKLNKATDIRAQYIAVDDADGTTDTGATKMSLGLFHKLDKKAQVYVAYGATDNDANAKFQAVDGGHGDEVKTVNGGNPSSISAGLIYKF